MVSPWCGGGVCSASRIRSRSSSAVRACTMYIQSAIHGNVSNRPEDVEAIHGRYDTLRAEAQPRHVSIELIREAEKLWI